MVAVTELVQDHDLISGGDRLKARLAVPATKGAYEARHALVFCHGLPSQDPVLRNDRTYDLLIGRIARDLGWTTLALSLRGCAGSQGNFSVEAWMTDLDAAVDHLKAELGATGVWLAGAGTGGSMAIAAGGHNPDVRGVAALAARADFDDWLAQPDRLIQHCRDIKV
ncbi:MAG: alpha/beta hydrolase family protein, partial [Acidimicrobiales bacterium]